MQKQLVAIGLKNNIMKILWVTNSIMPDLAIALGSVPSPFGGWKFGLSKDLSSNGVSLIIVSVREKEKQFYKKINGIEYFLLEGKKTSIEYDPFLEKQWAEVIDKTKPDLIHIHGSEHAHGLALINCRPNQKFILSIQGLTSVYASYYTSGISIKEIYKNITFKDLIKKQGILSQQKSFVKRGEIEKQYFQKISHVMGRTEWDKAHTINLNSSLKYHFCNESLRDIFYTNKKWNIDNIKKNTIFLSQAGYPIKGMHQVIKAVSLIKKEFPDVIIKFAGKDIMRTGTSLKDKLKMDGYGKYLNSLIKKYSLEENIQYLGVLPENQMHEEYLKSHVFICPSSIENSPNSLGEAQILGVPCISSYVGGVPDMAEHKKTALLYRFEEIEVLAEQIKLIFNDSRFANQLSKNGIIEATKRHNRETNLKNTLNIYSEIIS